MSPSPSKYFGLLIDTPPPIHKPHIRRYYAGATFGWVWGLYPNRYAPSPILWACSLPALTAYLFLASNARIAP